MHSNDFIRRSARFGAGTNLWRGHGFSVVDTTTSRQPISLQQPLVVNTTGPQMDEPPLTTQFLNIPDSPAETAPLKASSILLGQETGNYRNTYHYYYIYKYFVIM